MGDYKLVSELEVGDTIVDNEGMYFTIERIEVHTGKIDGIKKHWLHVRNDFYMQPALCIRLEGHILIELMS